MRNKNIKKQIKRERRKARIRAKVSGTSTRPRLSVFKSNKYLSAQIIDDTAGKTIVAVTSRAASGKKGVNTAGELGKLLAKNALAKKVKAVVFDRSGYIYTGKIKALADGARAGGLDF